MSKDWREVEDLAEAYLKNIYGEVTSERNDSSQSDFILPDGTVVECKMKNAQCGQFTLSTAYKNPYSIDILNGKCDDDTIRNWIHYHYVVNKNVSKFIIYNSKEEFEIMDAEEFFNNPNITFALESRSGTGKKSGSRPLPKRDKQFIPAEWNPYLENNHFYAEGFYGDRFAYTDAAGQGAVMRVSPSSSCYGRINKLSNTCNETWIFCMEAKI